MKLSAEAVESVWYTLVGFKILRQHFGKDFKSWCTRFKYSQSLRDDLGFSGDFETSLGQLNVHLDSEL
jgi:hypothetical protein